MDERKWGKREGSADFPEPVGAVVPGNDALAGVFALDALHLLNITGEHTAVLQAAELAPLQKVEKGHLPAAEGWIETLGLLLEVEVGQPRDNLLVTHRLPLRDIDKEVDVVVEKGVRDDLDVAETGRFPEDPGEDILLLVGEEEPVAHGSEDHMVDTLSCCPDSSIIGHIKPPC